MKTSRFARRAVVGVVLAAMGGIGRVGAQAPRAVTFEQAIAQALERNPTMAQAMTAITRAEEFVREARSGLMPTAALRVNSITIDSDRGFAGGVTQPQNQVFVSPSITMPILSLWQRSLVDQNRDQVEVANRSVTDTRQRVAVATAEAYLGVIAARRQLDIDLSALETGRAHLDYASRRLEGGVGSRLNQARAAQTVAIAEARVEAVRVLLRRAQEGLGVMLAEDGPVDASGEPVFDTPGPVDEAEWSAARPDLQLQAAVRRASERVIRDAFRFWTPEASVSFDPQFVGPSGLFQPSKTWRLTLSVTQPLFQGGRRRNLDSRLAEVDFLQSKLADTEIRIQARSEIRMAREALEGLERAMAAARRATEHARDVLKITTTAFEVGATTNLEVTEAQIVARDSETAAALAEDAVRRARLDLLVALGRFPR